MEKKDLTTIRKYLDLHLDQAAEQLAEEHGIHLTASTGHISYDGRGCTIKVEVCDLVDGVAQTIEARDFASMCHYWGLKPSDLGAEFVNKGRRFKLSGLKPRSPKFPFLAENLDDGKNYKFMGAVAMQIPGNTYIDSMEGKQDLSPAVKAARFKAQTGIGQGGKA